MIKPIKENYKTLTEYFKAKDDYNEYRMNLPIDKKFPKKFPLDYYKYLSCDLYKALTGVIE